MIFEDNNSGLSADAEELAGRVVVSGSGNTAYVVFVLQLVTVIVSGPTGNHPSRQVSGLLPEGLRLRLLLSQVDRLASPEDLVRLRVAERLSEHLPEEVLDAFQGLIRGEGGRTE